MGQFLYRQIGFLGLIGFSTIAFSQSVTLSLAPGYGTPGGAVTVPINVASTGGAQPTGLQWTFNYSSDITGVTVVVGASATNAGKSLSCSGNNCLVAGINSTVIADGTVASATFQIAANPSSNPIAIQLTSVVATTAGGASIPSSGGTGTITLRVAAGLSSLNCTSSTINTPGSTSCSVALTGAATGSGFIVSLSSNNANLRLPSSVTVASGQTSNTFNATGEGVSTTQSGVVTASAGGVINTSTLSLVAPAQLTSVACAPLSLGSNASSPCTVALNKAATSAETVSLASNNGLLTVPANVTVSSGQSSAPFTVTSGTVSSSQSAIVAATLGGQSQQVTISLAAVQISNLTCSLTTVNAPGTSTCTVTLTAAVSSVTSITLSSANANVTVPASVNIGAGLSSATFAATVAAVTSNQSALLTATLYGVSESFTLSATAPPPVQLTSVACAPSTLTSNASGTCTVLLNQAVTSAATVSLSSNSELLTVSANVTVASGQSSATFAAASGTVSSNQSAIVTATLRGQSQQTTISFAAMSAQLSSLNCSPATVTGPGTATCTATLTAAGSSAVSVLLLSNNTSVTVPLSVNIGAGLSSATLTVTVAAVTSNQTALLTASLNGVSKTVTISVHGAKGQPKSLHCAPSAMSSNKSGKCAMTLNAAATSDSVVSIKSNNSLLSVPPSITVPAGQDSVTFDATSGSVSANQNATITADLNGQSQQATITLAPPVNCQEFRTSPGGLCMIQDVFPWITFGGGWESRLNAGNLSNSTGGGTIQFSFTLLPAIPATGDLQNHMPAFFKDSVTGQTQVAESATYALSAGGSISVDFLSPASGCDINGQNCGNEPDPKSSSYGSLLVQYVADNPASLRGIGKAQLALLSNVANADSGWQTTESEMPAANLWTAPVSVSANQAANSQVTQQVSAALANPGPTAITVRGTLYDGNGLSVTFRDFQVPSLGTIALIFSQDPSQPFGGFGRAMFPQGQDFNGLVTFQVMSPSGASIAAMVLQYVGNSVSSVEANSQSLSVIRSSLTPVTHCAEFATAADGSCIVQYTLPWVVFGGGWESRLKAGTPPSSSSGAVQFRFALLPSVSAANGLLNHLPAYFTDNRTGQLQVGESANYTLGAGQSVDVHFLYPPAGCDSTGQHCASQPDPNIVSFGSVLVQYSAVDPASLRRLVYPQLAFLTRPGSEAYSSQITERAAAAASTWTAPVAMSADPNANLQTYRQVSAAINNSGPTPLTVKGTLRDQDGNVVTSNDFQIPASGTIGIVLSRDPQQPFGGFGNAAFPQGQDFNGWVRFDVTSQVSSGVNVLVLQYVGNTISSVNAQSLP